MYNDVLVLVDYCEPYRYISSGCIAIYIYDLAVTESLNPGMISDS